jgi:hypothetical protein
MCRGGKDTATPRRCPCSSPSRRRAYQNARYALKAGRKRHPLTVPVETPAAAPVAPEADLKTLLESVRTVAGPMFPLEWRDASPEDQLNRQERHLLQAQHLNEKYGGIDQAAIAAGVVIAARAEELSGTSADKVKDLYDKRLAEAEARYEAVKYASYDESEAAVVHLAEVRRGTDADTLREMRELADSYQAALAEVREFGGTLKLHELSDPKAAAKIQDITELYPTEWLEASNQHSLLIASATRKRAHYADWHDIHDTQPAPQKIRRITVAPADLERQNSGPCGPLRATGEFAEGTYRDRTTRQKVTGLFPVYEQDAFEVILPFEECRLKKDGTPWGRGDGWEKWEHPKTGKTYWRRPEMGASVLKREVGSEILTGGRTVSYIAGRHPDFAVSAHEFGHRTEYAVEGVKKVELSFLKRRTSTVQSEEGYGLIQEPLVPMSMGSTEMTRPDHFTNIYMGKDYGGDATEVMSMGMEGVFAGHYGGFIGVGGEKPDLEVRDLVLGVLASVGGRKERGSRPAIWDL